MYMEQVNHVLLWSVRNRVSSYTAIGVSLMTVKHIGLLAISMNLNFQVRSGKAHKSLFGIRTCGIKCG